MSWQQFPNGASDAARAGRVLFQWWDPDTARAWFLRAAERTNAAAIAAANHGGWSAQRAVVRDAWEALANAYRALTLPADQDPGYLDARAQTVSVGIANTGVALRRMGENGTVEAVVYAASLGANSRPVFRCLEPDPLTGELCDFGGLFSGSGQYGMPVQGCDPFDWRCVAWKGGVVGLDGYNPIVVLAPVVWSAEIAARVARYALERGMERVVLDTRMAVAARNIREADRVGVLPEDLRGAVLDAARALENARWDSPAIAQASGVLISAGATVATAGGPTGAAIGGALALLGTAVRAMPGAVGGDPRTTPQYVSPVIDGGGTLTSRPSFEVGWPPGMARTPSPEGAPAAVGEFFAVLQTPRPGVLSVGVMNPPPNVLSFVYELTPMGGTAMRQSSPDRAVEFLDVAPGSYSGRAIADLRDGSRLASRAASLDTTPAPTPAPRTFTLMPGIGAFLSGGAVTPPAPPSTPTTPTTPTAPTAPTDPTMPTATPAATPTTTSSPDTRRALPDPIPTARAAAANGNAGLLAAIAAAVAGAVYLSRR